MIEKIQFWAVLIWMVGMLVMAGFAIRAVWLEADQGKGDAESDENSKGKDPAETGTERAAVGSVEPR